MNNYMYLKSRNFMRKQAAVDLLSPIVNAGKNVAGFFANNAKESLMLAVPSVSLMTAWLAYRALSPQAVADNAGDYALNATRKASVIQSMRDLEEAQVQRKLRGGRRKPHDQFL